MLVPITIAVVVLGVWVAKKKFGGKGKNADGMGSFIMEINDREYTFVYKRGVSTAVDLAKKFCVEHGEDLGFTDETLGSCVEPLMSEIAKALAEDGGGSGGGGVGMTREGASGQQQQYDKDGIRQIPLEVNGVNYIFEFHQEMDADSAAVQLASEFCSTKGIEIGITPLLEDGGVDADGAVEKCVNPLREAIRTEIEAMRAEESGDAKVAA